MVEFEWDKAKAERNRKKCRISLSKTITVFNDPLELTIPDPDHLCVEFSFISIGISSANLLVVSYTERNQNQICIVSARRAARKE